MGPLYQTLWRNSKRPDARDASPDFLLFVCSLRRSYLQCGERGRSSLCVSVSRGSFSSEMFETSEENSGTESPSIESTVCVHECVCVCMPYGAPVCSLWHNGRRLISAYCFSQLPLSAQMTFFLHGCALNPFRFNWGWTDGEKKEKRKKGCSPCQDNQGSQQAGDLTKQMDLEHTRTWTKPWLLKNRRLLCCQKWYFGIFLILTWRRL